MWGLQKFWVHKNLLVENFFGSNKIGSPKMSGPTKILGPKTFGSTKIITREKLGPKRFIKLDQ